ncbi:MULTISPECIES: glycerol kinase GlpK [Nocardiopsis]|uniref:Glycerol kinase n=1 Tax=Nocardiopsis lambiniae TaxID=3075539 RepID=A0ABU2MHA6_9ACTN|nr:MULTISPECIES: glycerol kinase GlpK [unclassified Nocardiopsis]MDE3720922.1 glycerol kinase GlpK [Nocardiopsis sp. N85]MDT0332087.1 glycerol kinase GlpK [Nocardiopsis sp. DSM 44743]
MSQQYVAAIDQGTTSSRCILFDRDGRIVSVDQREHRQIFPRPGWVEHDAAEIWTNVEVVVKNALEKSDITPDQIAAIGITNQRETTVVWDKETGEPVHNAIVWQDTRTDDLVRELAADGGQDRFRAASGLPLATYFSGPKLRWLLDNVDGLRERAERGEVLFGTMDTWIIWKLTGRHVTDVTNASRTMLMNLSTLEWDPEILDAMGVPANVLPEIRSSSEVYGEARGHLAGTPVASSLGDQHAALFGQTCFDPGDVKGTYGTGTFLVMNTGTEPVTSENGLLTTLGYKLGDEPAVYALEGSIAVTGSLVQWLRDNLGLISTAPEIETLARTVEDNGGCYFVPAFSGLFAPHWRSDARGVITGLTGYVNKGHIARAVLEATAWQTREVVDAMNADSKIELTSLKVDGGMTADNLLMQILSDVLDAEVVRPMVAETTCLGAAYAAGLAVGYWPDVETLRANWHKAAEWTPEMEPAVREREYHNWNKAVKRTLDWVEHDEK